MYTDAFEAMTGQRLPYVFHRGGKPIRDYSGAWRTACRLAGLAGKIAQDCRRSAARNQLRAGVPAYWALQLTGHKTAAIFRRYAIVCESDLREAVTKLAESSKGTIGAQS